jgi:mRNA-degrading endonuclease RelE of RelBE toxin-antitoxin system
LSYRITFAEEAVEHLRLLTSRDREIVLDGIERHLTTEPLRETKNRKRMRPNPLAPWELRLGVLRVYFDVEREPVPLVSILAIGRKEREAVSIAGKVMSL